MSTSKKLELTPEMEDHITSVIDYLWHDEKKSYMELEPTDTEEAQGHIFYHVFKVAEWLDDGEGGFTEKSVARAYKPFSEETEERIAARIKEINSNAEFYRDTSDSEITGWIDRPYDLTDIEGSKARESDKRMEEIMEEEIERDLTP